MLAIVAKHGKVCLVLGLLAGVLVPGLAAFMRPWLPHLVALLLFLTAFRIGPVEAIQNLGALGRSMWMLLILQVAMPIAAIGLLNAFGVIGAQFAIIIVLLLAAPSATGTPNFTLLLGYDPAPALRLLILGTGLMPLTIVPVFWLLPQLGDIAVVLQASLRLTVVIMGATLAAFLLRHWRFRQLTAASRDALDGVTIIALAVIVLALMSEIAPAYHRDPAMLFGWLIFAFAINFGLQGLVYLAMKWRGLDHSAVPVAIIAGNRNIALFLVALPNDTSAALLIFIGCYQFPMYLTPILLGGLYGSPKSA